MGAVPAGAALGAAPGKGEAAAAGASRLTAHFPKDFVWGTATAAYQIEGAAAEDGRGPSVWDTFCRKPGAVFDGHTGDVACDHYHRFKEDVALLKKLGAQSYRFSLSWSRLLPDGRGPVNQKGVDFYNRLLDELARAGIAPLCTLFHWDFPQGLQDKGGWLNRDVAGWFGDYAQLCAEKFSDRIHHWATQNEAQVHIGMGHLLGAHAPGLKLSYGEYLTAAHNSMRAHARGVLALRTHVKGGAAAHKIGYVLAMQVTHPASDAPGDVEAARWAFSRVTERSPWNNAWWIDPVVLGRYPEDGIKLAGADMPKFPAADLDEMKQPLDYLGCNIYTSTPWRRGDDGKPVVAPVPPGYPRSGVDWQPLIPQCLYWGSRFAHERYKLPIAITEHGLATRDHVFLDGAVRDPQRIDFTQRCLLELARAIADGIPVQSYYHWSFLDNFEWADGYKQRFGLVYVDYQSQRRVPKDSFAWFAKVIATNGRSLATRAAVPVTVVKAV